MKAMVRQGLVLLSSTFAIGLASRDTMADLPQNVAGQMFQTACFGAAVDSCAGQRASWQTDSWTGGKNFGSGYISVVAQLPIPYSGADVYLKGTLSSNDGCYLLVSDNNGNVVWSHWVSATGSSLNSQTLFLGGPTVVSGQALTVDCTVEPGATIGMVWE